MSRFTGYAYPGGLFVLDTWTGEVVRIPYDGSPSQVVRPGVSDPMPPQAPGAYASTLVGGAAPPMPTAVGVPSPASSPGTQVAPPAPIPMDAPPAAARGPEGPAPATTGVVAKPPARPVAVKAPPAEDDDGLIPKGASQLDREVLTSFPYPIATTWRSFLSEEDPRQRCKLLVDTFTSVLKLWALQVASEYLAAEGVKDARVNDTLGRDFQRPLISAWNLMLYRALPVLEQAGVEPFAPELGRAYQRLEVKCRDKVIVSVPYEDADGNRRERKSKLGKIQALIKYRNSLAHGYNQSRKKAAKDLATHLPVLVDVLKEARFMARYPLCHVLEAGDEECTVHRLMGAIPSPEPERMPLPGSALGPASFFLWDGAHDRALPLSIFLDMDVLDSGEEAIPGLGRDVVLFEGNTRNTVIYVSVAGDHLEKQSRVEPWKAQLEDKAVEVRSLAAKDIGADSLRLAADRHTDQTLEKLVTSGKYIREASVARPDVDARFDQFEHGDYRGLVLAGENGMGKSTLLAQYVDEWRESGDIVLFYRASTLGDTDIAARILRDLGVRNMFFEDFLATAARKLPGERRLRVVIDSINEHPNDAPGLVRAIDAMVRQAESYPFFRVVAGIRTASYERLPKDARFGAAEGTRYLMVERQRGEETVRSPLVEVPPLPLALVGEVYEKYRAYRRPSPDDPEHEGVHLFRPQTPFAELDPAGTTCAMMTNPLMMRLLLTAFHRRRLPSHLSFDEAMELYVDHVIVERDNPEGSYPERRAFLRRLVRVLDDAGADAVLRERLYEVPALRPALQNTQKDSPYVQLLELGVLLEEWDGDECLVRFAFDGLFEYGLAVLHDPRVEKAEQLLRLSARALSFRSLTGALVIIARRALRQGRRDLLLEALDQAKVGVDGTIAPEHTLFADVVRDMIVELARFRDDSLDSLLEEMPREPSAFDVEVLLRAFDRLFGTGETLAAAKVVDAAVAETDLLGDARLRAGALLRRGRLEEHRGELDEAFATLEAARAVAIEANADLAAYRIDNIRARILLTRGEFDEALAVYDTAFSGLSSMGELAEAAQALRGKATIFGRRDDRDRQEKLTLEAIELCERAGDRSGLGKALNNLAMVYTFRRQYEEAERAFQRSLATKRELGERTSVGITVMNLGSLYYSQGKVEEAMRSWREALAMCEATDHHEGRVLAITNLAIGAQMRHRIDEARDLFAQSLRLFEERQDPRGTAYSVWLSASFAFDQGEVDRARDLTARLGELDAALGRIQPKVHHAGLAVRLACVDGDEATVRERLSAFKTLVEEHGASGWDVEDGPAPVYVDAARFLTAAGDEAGAVRLAEAARSAVAGRPFHRAAALAALPKAQAAEGAENPDGAGEGPARP